MEIRVRTRGVVDILEFRGRPEAPNVSVLRDQVQALIEAGEPLLVLDLSRVSDLDSAWLGELVACRERVRKHDGVIKIVAVRGPRDLLVASGLDRLFEIYPDEEQALDSFSPESETAGVP
jgi:anti-anti-sigma factor